MPMLKTNGAEIYFEQAGHGSPVLMIAGVASDLASWAPVVPLLEDKFRLILADNRGCGRTRSEGPIHFDDYLNDYVLLLDQLGFDAIDIVGHSLGGLIGLHLAARYPNRVRKLITLGAGANAKSLTLLQDLATLYESETSPRLFFRLLFQFLFSTPFFENPSTIEATVDSSLGYKYCQSPADFRRQIDMFDTIGMLDTAAITAPVLAVAGGGDLMAPPLGVTMLHAGIAHRKDILIPEIGHSTHWEAPGRVADLMTDFLVQQG